MTNTATINAIKWCGLTPVYCDINYDDMTIDAGKISDLVTRETEAVLGVDIFGNLCHRDRLRKLAEYFELQLIYDCAQSFSPLEVPYKLNASMNVYSFHATKLFHTIEGGAIATFDADEKESIDIIRNHGIKDGEHKIDGCNGKMSELHAIMGLFNLGYIDKEREQRKKLRSYYIESGVPFCKTSDDYACVRMLTGRDETYRRLRDNNIDARKYFGSFADLPNANKVADEILCLPLHGRMTTTDIDRIRDVFYEN